ncbi:inositol monophosphatase, partial [Enterobacter hormaechei]|nr:inositol monophosphatase [Enterobacter hormaechei]
MAIELSFLRRIAEVAAAQTLPRFRTVSSIDNKYQVGFDPVTEADREAERAIRALINSTFPAHG